MPSGCCSTHSRRTLTQTGYRRWLPWASASGCHPYYPQYIATTGYEYAEQNPYAVPSWPQPWFPMGMVQDGAVPLVIQGDLSGAALSFHVWDGMEGTEISVRADGAPVETVVLSGGVPTEDGNFQYFEQLHTVTLPQGTAEVEIQISEAATPKSTPLSSAAPWRRGHGAP